MIQKFWGFWFRYLMFWPQNYVDQGCVLVLAAPVFTCNFCVFLSYHTLLCFCVRILCVCFCVPMIVFFLLCVCFYVKKPLCFCVPVQCLCFLVLVHCVWLNVLCTCFWVPILCVCFLCSHTRRVLLNKWNNLVGITSLLLQCHPGKNNPMILRLMFTT